MPANTSHTGAAAVGQAPPEPVRSIVSVLGRACPRGRRDLPSSGRTGRIASRIRRLAAVAALATPACGGSDAVGLDDERAEEPLPSIGAAAALWVGDYRGSGNGDDMGEPFDVDDVPLRIAFDADSVARAACPMCVTVEFPPWFVEANVPITDPETVFVTFTDGTVVRTLSAERSAAGGDNPGNALFLSVVHQRPADLGGATFRHGTFRMLQLPR